MRSELKWRKSMYLVLSLGSVRALLSFLSSYTYPVPENSCDWSPGLSSSMSSCLGTRVTSVGAHDIFLSLLAWCELSYSPCEACRNLCHFWKVCKSVGTGTQVTAVTMRLCKDPHRVQSAGAVLGHREVILISLYCFILCFHPGGLLASSHHLCQQLGAAGSGEDKWRRFLFCQ